MARKRLLAGVCIAAVLVGTQGMAEDTGVTSAPNMTQPATPVMSVEQDLLQEVDQVEMLQQAIREVEFRLLNEGKVEVAGDAAQDVLKPENVQTESAEAATEQVAVQKAASASGSDVAEKAESLPDSTASVGTTDNFEPLTTVKGETSPSIVDDTSALQHQTDSTDMASGNSAQAGVMTDSTAGFLPNLNEGQFESVVPFESGFVQTFPNGKINWFTGVVTASGESFASGLAVSQQQSQRKTVRAATIDARKNLLEILSRIPVNEKLLVRNILRKDDDVMQFVRGDMQNSRIVSTEFTEDGIATVRVSITLRDLFLEKLIGKHVAFQHSRNNPYSAANVVAESIKDAVSASDSTNTDELDFAAGYTGLLIDARDVGVQPAITVNVVDEAGNILYSPRSVDRDAALKYGMAEYVANWDEALASKRALTNPLVLKAVSSQGRMRSNIVISDEQARLLEQINNDQNFLEQGRVIIVCN